MKAKEVLNLLQISRKTLHVYSKDGRIRYTVMPNKQYSYNEEMKGYIKDKVGEIPSSGQ